MNIFRNKYFGLFLLPFVYTLLISCSQSSTSNGADTFNEDLNYDPNSQYVEKDGSGRIIIKNPEVTCNPDVMKNADQQELNEDANSRYWRMVSYCRDYMVSHSQQEEFTVIEPVVAEPILPVSPPPVVEPPKEEEVYVSEPDESTPEENDNDDDGISFVLGASILYHTFFTVDNFRKNTTWYETGSTFYKDRKIDTIMGLNLFLDYYLTEEYLIGIEYQYLLSMHGDNIAQDTVNQVTIRPEFERNLSITNYLLRLMYNMKLSENQNVKFGVKTGISEYHVTLNVDYMNAARTNVVDNYFTTTGFVFALHADYSYSFGNFSIPIGFSLIAIEGYQDQELDYIDNNGVRMVGKPDASGYQLNLGLSYGF